MTYKLIGDNYTPLVKVPEPPKIGIWGMHCRDYLKNHRRAVFHAMLMGEPLNLHLEEVDRQATELYDRLIPQFAIAEGITEEPKATNQMEWVARMTTSTPVSPKS